MTEELGFQEGFGNRAAIESDESVRPARAVVMDSSGDDFLARAGFPSNEDRAVRACHGLKQVKQLLHRPASPENSAELIALLELRSGTLFGA